VGGVIRGNAYLDAVSNHHLDAVLFHAAGKAPADGHVIITLDFHNTAPQDPGYFSFQLDSIISAQSLVYSFRDIGMIRNASSISYFDPISQGNPQKKAAQWSALCLNSF
jgi:hypothetical protein